MLNGSPLPGRSPRVCVGTLETSCDVHAVHCATSQPGMPSARESARQLFPALASNSEGLFRNPRGWTNMAENPGISGTMSIPANDTSRFLALLKRSSSGDAAARGELLNVAYERLRRLARTMFHDFPKLQAWEETDDVWQSAAMRFDKALQSHPPSSVAEFFGLAARQIRWQLLDLARRYKNLMPPGNEPRIGNDESTRSSREPGSNTDDPQRLEKWTRLHEEVDNLPEELRQAFDLLYYSGLTQEEAAELLHLSVRTVRARWRAVRLALYNALEGQMPF